MPALSLNSHAEQLRQRSWADIATFAWLSLLVLIGIKAALPAAIGVWLRPLVLVAPVLPFIAKDLAHWPDALQRLRAAAAARAWMRMPAACVPPELLGLLRLGAATRRGCLQWLLRRTPAAPAQGQQLTYLERGSYSTVVLIVLLACLVELPLHAALLPLFVKDAHKLHILHTVMAFGSLSTLAWLLGDRWLVARGCHVLGADGLELRVGARTTGTIPLDAIADCRRIDMPAAAWCRANGVARRHTLAATPFDKPNVVLLLQPENAVRLEHMGVAREDLACVFLYLDRPEQLMQALRRAGR